MQVWEGWGTESNSWEPTANISADLIADYDSRMAEQEAEDASERAALADEPPVVESEAEGEGEGAEEVSDGESDADADEMEVDSSDEEEAARGAEVDSSDEEGAHAHAAAIDSSDEDEAHAAAVDSSDEEGEVVTVTKVTNHKVYGGARVGGMFNVYLRVQYSDGTRSNGVIPGEPLVGSPVLAAYLRTSNGAKIAKYIP